MIPQPIIDDILRRTDLAQIAGRRTALKRRGVEFWGCCPFHKEKSASFHIRPNGFFKCFACGASGDAIRFVMNSENLSFLASVELLADLAGVEIPGRETKVSRKLAPVVRDTPVPVKVDNGSAPAALRIWDKCVSAIGTHAESYLKARGIKLPMSPEIRFHPSLRYAPSGEYFPTLVARLSDAAGFRAVQRTYLDPVKPTKANVETPKRCKGGMQAGAVRLRAPRDVLGIAEGIETALSAAQIYSVPTWACLGAGRLARIDIPESVEQIILFSDAGEVGRIEAFKAADEYELKGYRVEVITPQAHHKDAKASDFNDLLRSAA